LLATFLLVLSYKSVNLPSKLLEQVRNRLRVKHYSICIEDMLICNGLSALFHGKRHPNELGAAEVEQFLTDLAVNRHVSSALLFLYREVLGIELLWLDNVVRAKPIPAFACGVNA